MLWNRILKKQVRYGIIAAAWTVYLVIAVSLVASGRNTSAVSAIPEDEMARAKARYAADTTVYTGNETIDRFLRNYNAANPENALTPQEAARAKSGEGKLKLSGDGFNVTITESGVSLKVVVLGTRRSNDEFEAMFRRYIRGFDRSLDDAGIWEFWNRLFTAGEHRDFLGSISCALSLTPGDKVEYFSIFGTPE